MAVVFKHPATLGFVIFPDTFTKNVRSSIHNISLFANRAKFISLIFNANFTVLYSTLYGLVCATIVIYLDTVSTRVAIKVVIDRETVVLRDFITFLIVIDGIIAELAI